MTNPLEGIQKKLTRADVHIGTLESLLEDARKSDSYRLVAEPYPDKRRARVRVHIINELPADDLAPIVGDAVHNLRSSLDYLVWALTVQHQGFEPLAPLDTKCWWRRVHFPIYDKPASWSSDQGTKGVGASLRQRLRTEQPFMAGKANPWQRWPMDPTKTQLWILEELWSRDKHRALVLVLGHVRVASREPVLSLMSAVFGVQRSLGNQPIFTRKFYGPVKNQKVIAQVIFDRPMSRDRMQEELDKAARPSLDVIFDKGMPAENNPVIGTLRGLQTRVTRLIDRFGRDLVIGNVYPMRPCPPPCRPA